jgi:hypothetical protein
VSVQKRIHIDRKIRSDSIDQTRIERSNPRLVSARAHGVIEFDVAAEVPDDRARQSDGILPLHAHATAARLVENVDPGLSEQCEPPRQ